jgi:hypothetical protein
MAYFSAVCNGSEVEGVTVDQRIEILSGEGGGGLAKGEPPELREQSFCQCGAIAEMIRIMHLRRIRWPRRAEVPHEVAQCSRHLCHSPISQRLSTRERHLRLTRSASDQCEGNARIVGLTPLFIRCLSSYLIFKRKILVTSWQAAPLTRVGMFSCALFFFLSKK